MNRHESDSLNAGYCEYLTPVKASAKTVLARMLIILITAAIVIGMLAVTLKTVPVVSFMLSVAVIFLSWFFFQFTKIEYEYVIATGILELSKIYGARTRKKMLEIKTSDIFAITPLSDIGSLNITKENVLYACNKDDKNAVCLGYTGSGSVKKVLVISTPKKTVTCLKHYRRPAFSPLMNI